MKKLMNFRPVLFIAMFILCALISAYLLLTDKIVLGIILPSLFFVTVICISIAFGKKNLKRNFIFIAIALVISAVAVSIFTVKFNNYKNASFSDSVLTVNGRVKDVSDYSDSSVKLVLDDLSFSGVVKGNTRYSLYLYVSGKTNIDVGDKITFTATVSSNELFYEGRFMADRLSNGVKYSAFINESEITVFGNSKTIFEKANVFIRNTLKSGLDEKEFVVGYALLCGNSDYMENDTLSSYRLAGVSHIFAVSGLHIGFLATVLSFILKRVRMNEYIKAIIIIVLMLFYSGICGFSSSSLRATVMYGIMLLARCKGERYDGLSALSLAFIILLLISPAQLFCAGFILSFTVVLGLIVLSPTLTRLLRFLPPKIASSLSAVFSAQIFSIPACIMLFNKFSTVAVLVNLLFLPLVGVIFILLFTLTLVGGIFNIPYGALFVPNYILKGVNYGVNFFDYSIFIVSGLTVGIFAITYYLTFICCSDIINIKRIYKGIVSIVLSLITISGVATLTIKENTSVKFYVLGSNTLCTTLIKEPNENTLIISYAKDSFSINRLKSLAEYQDVNRIDNVLISNFDGGFSTNSLITRLNVLFDLKNVYFCKEENKNEIAVLKDSFKGVEFYAIGSDGRKLSINKDFCYIEQGYALCGAIRNKKFIVFSKLGLSHADISKSTDNFNLVIGYDYLERVNAFYGGELFVSYLKNSLFVDGEKNGTYLHKIR